MHTGIYSISMSIDGSESGLIGIPLGWGLYGSEPECTVAELELELGRIQVQVGADSVRGVELSTAGANAPK